MVDLTLMSLRAMTETALSVGAGVTTVGGAILWLFREKISRWVKAQIHPRIERIEKRAADMEDRMEKVEREQASIGQSFTSAASAIAESVARLTTQVQRVADGHDETKESVAFIRGRMAEREQVGTSDTLEQRGVDGARRRRTDR